MNIKRTLKRLIDEYVAALEKQNDLLKENLQQKKKVLSHLTLCLSATSRAL